MLVAGLAALFFLFNVGQLTSEKTKLVNTSDAVAYSAGVMHARAMNFASYTNRALVADEVAIAQTVSLASWGQYLEQHGQSALGLGCDPDVYYGAAAEPVAKIMLIYAPVCEALGYASRLGVLSAINESIQTIGKATAVASEASKQVLKASQTAMTVALPLARSRVMQDVANANYQGDGQIKVDEIPLRDTFHAFGGGPMMHKYEGEERRRMRNLVVDVVGKDGFTPRRNWSDSALIPEPSCIALGFYHDYVTRTGSTQLIGFDEWRAQDNATYYRWRLKVPKLPALPYCRKRSQTLGRGSQSATIHTSASSDDWGCSGIPSYTELSEAALQDPDPRAQFAVRLLRNRSQTRTSDARSDIKNTPRLNAYVSNPPSDTLSGQKVYVGLSASETFFQRPTERGDKKNELASLFNPYWQTHLMEVPAGVRTAAQALQGAVAP